MVPLVATVLGDFGFLQLGLVGGFGIQTASTLATERDDFPVVHQLL